MRNKPADVLYCGVDRNKVEHANPKLNKRHAEYLYRYIIDRYTLHINKDIKKLQAPWIDNKIIADHRFTNVKRELDKQTKWAIENIANNPELSYKDKLLNMVLFRLFSRYETMELIQAPYRFTEMDEDKLKKVLRILSDHETRNPDYKFFTTAFFTNGVKKSLSPYTGSHFFPYAVVKYVYMLSRDNDFRKIRLCKDQKDVYELLRNLPALGDFMAYQVFVDFTYIPEFPFSENEFTVAGVGAKKGLDYLFDNLGGLNYEEALFWLRDNIEKCMDEADFDKDGEPFFVKLNKLMTDVPIYDRNMNLMSLENCMCELGKYCDIVYNVGRPRPKYRGGH